MFSICAVSLGQTLIHRSARMTAATIVIEQGDNELPFVPD